MTIAAIIPARFASTRLPAKALLKQTGKFLIQHVVEQVRLAKSLDIVAVATDHEDIVAACDSFGCRAIMTSPDHTSGSDRIAEAADKLGLADSDIVVNIQGDEPDIPPVCVEKLIELIKSTPAEMATLATALDMAESENPNRVKVVVAQNQMAMYFSRAAIPFDRDGVGCDRLLHIGAYAYNVSFLRKFTQLPPSKYEQLERLEQLRALENGYPIAVAVVDYDGCGIDTPPDYAAFVERFTKL